MARDLMSSKRRRGGQPQQRQQPTAPTPELEARLKQYQGMDTASLEQQLFAAVAQQKASGQFDPASLDQMFQKLAPMLNDEQKQRMLQLITKVKD